VHGFANPKRRSLFDDWNVYLGCVDFLIELWWKFCGAQELLIHVGGDTIHDTLVNMGLQSNGAEEGGCEVFLKGRECLEVSWEFVCIDRVHRPHVLSLLDVCSFYM
jgi:hypothetical protein